MDLIYWVILVLSLLLSFIFSGSETGFLTASKLLLNVRSEQQKKLGKVTRFYVSNPETFLITILVGNNLVAVTFTTIATLQLSLYLNPELTWLTITFIILLFGEIIPKTLFRSLADNLFIYFTPLIRLAQFVLAPVIFIIEIISKKLMRLLKVPNESFRMVISRREFEDLVIQATGGLNVHPEHRDILQKLLKLEKADALSAMIPRTEVIAASTETKLETLISLFSKFRLSRILVYKETLDNVIGYIHYRDLILPTGDWTGFIKPILFFPETKKLDEVLSEFRLNNEKIGVVIDEHGGVEGILTIEDVLEELLGSILDEFDVEEPNIKKVNSDTYLIKAHTPIPEINEETPFNIPTSTEYQTISGFVLKKMGKIPRVGEKILIDDQWKIIVLEVMRTGMRLLRVQKETRDS